MNCSLQIEISCDAVQRPSAHLKHADAIALLSRAFLEHALFTYCLLNNSV